MDLSGKLDVGAGRAFSCAATVLDCCRHSSEISRSSSGSCWLFLTVETTEVVREDVGDVGIWSGERLWRMCLLGSRSWVPWVGRHSGSVPSLCRSCEFR